MSADSTEKQRSRWRRTGSGNEGRVGAGEEEGALGLLDRLAEAAHGDVHHPALLLLGRVEEVHKELCEVERIRISAETCLGKAGPCVADQSGGDRWGGERVSQVGIESK